MSEELDIREEFPDFGSGVFIPSHLTLGLVASGVAVAAGGLSLLATGYALNEFRKVRLVEVRAFVIGH